MKAPSIFNISLPAILFQYVVLYTIIFLLKSNGVSNPALKVIGVWFLLVVIVRCTFRFNYQAGITRSTKMKFAEAIPYFEKSYNFFKRYTWLDKFRYLFLLSVSKTCYREMALLNIAFCYGQIGEGKKSIEYYERTLLEFPNSTMAASALRLLKSVAEKQTDV